MDADIDLFVREKATGSERPTPVPYENYYHPTSADMLSGPGVKVGGGVPPPSQRELPPTPDDAVTEDAPSNECECGRVRGWEVEDERVVGVGGWRGGGYNINLY